LRSGKYYRGIKVNGRKIDYHRYLMEQKLGRPLSRYEVVHHKDGNKQNNSIDNLELKTLPEHSREHMTGRKMKAETKARMSASRKGKPNYACRKLNASQLAFAQKMLDNGMTYRTVARHFGVDHTTIMRYCRKPNQQERETA